MSDIQPWRVVLPDGTVRVVAVTLCSRAEGPRWSAGDDVGRAHTPRGAVLAWCFAKGLEAAEIRGPGELTTAERVAAEREACAAIVHGLAEQWANEATDREQRGERGYREREAASALCEAVDAIRQRGGARD